MKKIISILIFVFAGIVVSSQIVLRPSDVSCKQRSLGNIFCINGGRVPQFPGGDSMLQNYLVKHLVLENKLYKKAAGKIVQVQFDVDTIGKIWNVRLVNEEDIDQGIKNCVIDLICNMPDWIPGGVGNKGDSEYYNINMRVNADIHFWTLKNKIETPAYISIMEWPKGKIKKEKPKEEQIFSFAETMPMFHGEVDGFQMYIHQNLKYPSTDKQGTVYIGFVVEKDGSISNIRVEKSSGDHELDNEALRVVSSMPKEWTAGTMNGRKVRVNVIQPVKFTTN